MKNINRAVLKKILYKMLLIRETELEFLQVPFIAIPYPFATDNHQYENALYYKSKNTCWVLEQKNFTSNNLSLLLLEIFNNNNDLNAKRKKMFEDRKLNTLEKIKKEMLI